MTDTTPWAPAHADQTVLIAGGTSGVGLASALRLAEAGVPRLVLSGRDAARGERARAQVLAHSPRTDVLFRACDAGAPGAAEALVADTLDHFGGLDTVVCSTASSHRPELLHRLSEDDIVGTLTDQALPPLLLTRAAWGHLRGQGGGCVLTVASDAAKVATPGESALGAAMAAIVMYSRVAAIEGKRDGIRVNALTPSLIADTATTEHVMRDGFSRKLFEKAATQAHLGVATADDLAHLVVFLSSPSAARITGQAISANGGISAA